MHGVILAGLMKADIHPDYREVVFVDTASGATIITRSTIATTETTDVDGVEYPLAKVEISAASHPFYTGTMTIVDTAGRVERFEKRYGRRKKRAGEVEAVEAKEAAPVVDEVSDEYAEDAAPTEAPTVDEAE